MKYLEGAAEQVAGRLFAQAQEELISRLLRSDFTRVAPASRREWLDDTIAYLGDRYPGLSGAALQGLRALADGYLANGVLREPARRTA